MITVRKGLFQEIGNEFIVDKLKRFCFDFSKEAKIKTPFHDDIFGFRPVKYEEMFQLKVEASKMLNELVCLKNDKLEYEMYVSI